MLSSVLHSNRSIAVNIVIMRAFVKLRELSARSQELVRQLSEMGKKYDARFRQVFRAIRQLMQPVAESVPPRRGIGFTADHSPPRKGRKLRP